MIDKPRRGAPEKPAHLRKSPRSVALTPLQSAKLDILAAAHGVSGSAWVALQIEAAPLTPKEEGMLRRELACNSAVTK